MDTAIAVKYGGMPIKAFECNEKSYLELGLLCPACKDIVRWVAPKVRVSPKGKIHEVKAHFAHFKTKDLLSEDQCKLRVSRLSTEDIQRMERVAYSQRAKYFQRWFWKIIEHHIIRPDCCTWPVLDVIFLRGEYSDKQVNTKIEQMAKEFDKKYKSFSFEASQNFFDVLQDSENLVYAMCSTNYIPDAEKQIMQTEKGFKEWITDFSALAQSRLHRQITCEAIAFLGAKRNYNIRRALLVYIDLINAQHEQDGLQQINLSPYNLIASLLCVIPWAKEFSDLAEGKPLNSVSHSGIIALSIIHFLSQELSGV